MRTIYEASPVSLFMLLPLAALTFGVIVVRRRVFCQKSVRWFGRLVGGIWLLVWVSVWTLVLVQLVAAGLRSTVALHNGRCQIVEGTVEVLHRGSPNGHDGGDRIRVGTNEFQIEPGISVNAMYYHKLIADGGVLTNGAYARLHVLGHAIVKVEIKP